MVQALRQINEEMKKTIVMVTHDPQMASNCSRIIFLKDGMIRDDISRTGGREEFYDEILKRMGEL